MNIVKRRKLLINAFILTFTTVTLGFINTGFRVYISNEIGAEGMGLYQLIMSIHIMTSTFAISGIRVTTTRLIAEELGKNNRANIKKIMNRAFVYSLFFSSLTTFVIYNSSEFIAIKFIGDERTIFPLKILALSLPFISICSCLHGYFYGMRKIVKSITSDILEVSSSMIIIITFLGLYLPKGLDYTCILVAIAMTVANILAAVYSYILYLFEKKSGFRRIDSTSSNCSLLTISKIAFPIACSAYIQTGLRTLEDILIPNALRQFGSTTYASLSIFGMIKGMVLPILCFPSIFLTSFSTLIIPEIAEAKALNQTNRVNSIISRVFKFTLMIAVFASGLFIIYYKEMGITIYNSAKVGDMMRILAPLIPFMYLDRVVDGSLNALDQQVSTLKYNLIDMSVRIALIFFVIPKKGIEGFILVLFVGTLLNATLSINKLLKVTKLEFLIGDWIFKPAVSVTLSATIVKYIFDVTNIKTLIIPQVLLVILFYFIFLILFKSIRKNDVMWFINAFRKDINPTKISDVGFYKFYNNM